MTTTGIVVDRGHGRGRGHVGRDRCLRRARPAEHVGLPRRLPHRAPAANAAAISGEYLSAASFLGVAGLILRDGVDALWYPIGFAAGYLALVFFVVAPLRRSGRLHGARLRRGPPALARACAGSARPSSSSSAGSTCCPSCRAPGSRSPPRPACPTRWARWRAAVVVVVTVLIGGMRSVTFVQAFQFWLKFTALVIPHAHRAGLLLRRQPHASTAPPRPRSPSHTTVWIKTDVRLQVTEPVHGRAPPARSTASRSRDQDLTWQPGLHTVASGAVLGFPAGTATPVVEGAPADDATWLLPQRVRRRPTACSALLAADRDVPGHDGPAARPRALLHQPRRPRRPPHRRVRAGADRDLLHRRHGGRGDLPALHAASCSSAARPTPRCCCCPQAVLGQRAAGDRDRRAGGGGGVGDVPGDVLGPRRQHRGRASRTDVIGPGRSRVSGWVATIVGGLVPLLVSQIVMRMEFAEAVALVFALAASTFCPLLVLGIWWRGLTPPGAVAGVATGGVLAGSAIVLCLAGYDQPGLVGVLMERPAIVSVPAAFLVMVVVSVATAKGCPVAADQLLLRLHAPERLGLTRAGRAADRVLRALTAFPRTGHRSLPRRHVSTTQTEPPGSVYEQVQASPEFRALRRRLRRFVFPMSALFLVWYLAYVLLASYARPFMAIKLVGQHHRRAGAGPAAVRQHVRHHRRCTCASRGARSTPPAAEIRRRMGLPVNARRQRRASTSRSSWRSSLVTLVVVYRAARGNRTASDYYAAGRGLHRRAERRRDRGRLPLGRLVPRHRGRHRAERLRRLPLLDRLPRRLAGGAAAGGRAAAQHRQVHDRRRARVPDAAAAGAGGRGGVDAGRVAVLPARPDGGRGRPDRAAAADPGRGPARPGRGHRRRRAR